MKNKKKWMPRMFVAVWLMLLVALGGYYLFFAPTESAYSETENRTLAAFPQLTAESLFSGKFGKDMEAWLLDRFPLRNKAISLVNQAESKLSMATHDEYLQIADGVKDPLDQDDFAGEMDDLLNDFTQPSTVPTEPTKPTETQPVITEPVVTEPVEDPPIEQKPPASLEDYEEYLGVYMDTGDGAYPVIDYSRKNVAAVTAVLNKYASLLPENGKLMFTMCPPSYVMNRFVNAKEKKDFFCTWDEMINGLSSNNVYAFDSAQILGEGIQKGEYVAFRTDTHWTPYGAYMVYRQMAQQAGKIACSYQDDFEITVEENFRGTYYRDDPAAYMDVQPDTLECLMPKNAVEYRKITGRDTYELMDFLDFDANPSDRYTIYLSGPGGPWRYMECDNEQTENCLVLTDSFGLTVMPFLTQNYKQVHYYDPRYFDEDTVGYTVAEMIEKYEIQDIYVVVGNVHCFDSGFLISNANSQLGID